MKLLLACAFFILALGSGSAHAVILDLQPPDQLMYGPSLSQDGYTFTHSEGGMSAYINWIAFGLDSNNANGTNPTVATHFTASHFPLFHDITIRSLTNDAFKFESIGMADGANRATGFDVNFTFNFAGGGASTLTRQTTAGIFGLQNFSFDELAVLSVVITFPMNVPFGFQFDNVGLSPYNVAATPIPGTLALLASALGGMGWFNWFRRKRRALTIA